jgi:hypothetical protein
MLEGGERTVDTFNALGVVNGKQLLASPEQVAILKNHICTFQSPYTDLRPQIRDIELELFEKYSGFLIGNQCVDFQKQDGATEIEEAIQASTIERRLNDLLLAAEAEGQITIHRKPIYVSAVSNFTNFLDLSRKTLRSLEVGVPVVILSRSQTSQHSYRWAKLLVDLLASVDKKVAGSTVVDPGMVTFLSCSLHDIKDITKDCANATGNLYTTCSRALAAEIKEGYPNTVASTGGPNTLVCVDWNPKSVNHAKLVEAIAMSASIESAGQCTALRHCVLPKHVTEEDCQSVFDRVTHVDSAVVALEKSQFAGVFAQHPANPEPSTKDYQKHRNVDAFLKVRVDELPPPDINEYWRKVVVDFSKFDLLQKTKSRTPIADEEQIAKLAKWLNVNQPISLAVNGPRQAAIEIGIQLWERTGLVVNTIGSTDDAKMPPALTCQARPQDGEIFGEFPPRSTMATYTKFPVLVPSSNPSCDAVYCSDYLKARSGSLGEYILKSTKSLVESVKSDEIRGYCIVIIEYLQGATHRNPKMGVGKARTALWGLQRPPLGTKTILRCANGVSWDDIAPTYIIFHATNAREQAELSIDPEHKSLLEFCKKHKIPYTMESKDDWMNRVVIQENIFHSVSIASEGWSTGVFPMAGNFVSLFLPLGHIKSTMPSDEQFAFRVNVSGKWLSTLF